MLVDKLFKGSAILYIKWRRGKGRTGELFYENSNHFIYEISEVIEKTPTIYASYISLENVIDQKSTFF